MKENSNVFCILLDFLFFFHLTKKKVLYLHFYQYLVIIYNMFASSALHFVTIFFRLYFPIVLAEKTKHKMIKNLHFAIYERKKCH